MANVHDIEFGTDDPIGRMVASSAQVTSDQLREWAIHSLVHDGIFAEMDALLGSAYISGLRQGALIGSSDSVAGKKLVDWVLTKMQSAAGIVPGDDEKVVELWLEALK